MKMLLLKSALIAGAVALSSNVLAHGGATGIVKERMDQMVDMKHAMKAVAPMFRGKLPYDAEQVRKSAAIIESVAGSAMTDKFPEGSMGHGTDAKVNIWQEWDKFQSLSDDLKRYSKALGEASERREKVAAKPASMMGGSSMMGAAKPAVDQPLSELSADRLFKMVTDSCSSCHRRFREDKK